ncbi:transmembrane protein 60 [Bacillus rossius redtenbacheri]|uniref:transmembrane protein 60 n=1 Tax=Bacillus rossius redtenbacheri TaxID=93214 RepID=UPI002FDED623
MAVLHRALFTWFILLVFLILLVLRLDSRTEWNWFIVFVPLWAYDVILLIYVLFSMISLCKSGHDRLSRSLHRKILYMVVVVLKMVAQVVICLNLEYPAWNMPFYYVMIPLWLLLPLLSIDVFISLVTHNAQY